MDARSHRCQDIVDEGAAGRVGGGHSSGTASRSVPVDSRDGRSDQSLVLEADVATFQVGTLFLREDLGQSRPASVRVSGVSSRASVEPGPCSHSPGSADIN